MKNWIGIVILLLPLVYYGQSVEVQGSLKVTTVTSDPAVTDILGINASGTIVKRPVSSIGGTSNVSVEPYVSPTGDTLRIGNSIDFVIIPGISAANYVTDGSGNNYRTTNIGGKIWLRTNLHTTKFNDGTDIPLRASIAEWTESLFSPGYCWYNNDKTNFEKPHGALYNLYAVFPGRNGGKNLCPIGFRLPSYTEFLLLNTAANPCELKLPGQAVWRDWQIYGNNGKNLTLFSAVPNNEYDFSIFENVNKERATFWATPDGGDQGDAGRLNYNNCQVDRREIAHGRGSVVRCIKN